MGRPTRLCLGRQRPECGTPTIRAIATAGLRLGISLGGQSRAAGIAEISRPDLASAFRTSRLRNRRGRGSHAATDATAAVTDAAWAIAAITTTSAALIVTLTIADAPVATAFATTGAIAPRRAFTMARTFAAT